MHIGILPFRAALVASLCESLSGRLITAIKPDFIEQFLARIKEFSLFAFLKEFLVLLCPVSKQHAAASRDFEAARGVLIWPRLSQKPQANL